MDCQEDQHYEETTDLANLEQITLQNVLDCLVTRFKCGHYYTFAGSVLVSLNPCLRSRRSILTDPIATCKEGNGENVPHVYSIGHQCLDNLEKTGRSQVIIVSGESGAGKTTATQQLLRFFIDNGQTECGVVSGLERKIYFASQILEGFGNASTTANPNSSRFGRLIEIHFNGNRREILGARIETCLMEKHRVARWAAAERNFHIFYYVLEAIRQQKFCIEKIMKGISRDVIPDLVSHDFVNAVRPSDSEELSTFFDAIEALQMNTEITETFRIIFGLMILLSLKFSPVGDDKENQSDSEDDSASFGLKKRLFRVVCTKLCKEAVEHIFKIEFHELEDVLVARNFSAGRRKSCIRKPCETLTECKERLSALVMSVYDGLFEFILCTLNNKLELNLKEESNTARVSLLDLYGFESLQLNNLEQICINYANERLQQVYVANMKQQLKSQRNEELAETYCGARGDGLRKTSEFDRIETEVTLRLENMQKCLFSTLNETCVLNRRQADEEDTFGRFSDTVKSNDMFRISKKREVLQFTIRHYAGEVNYTFQGMTEKNRDYVPPELLDLLRNNSGDKMLQLLLQSVNNCGDTPTGKFSGKSKRDKTVLQRFKASVEGLMSRLGDKDDDDRDIHFIRCIRPNHDLQRGKIVSELVEKQLYSCGIVDAIRITANGFPIRISPTRLVAKFPHALRCWDNSNGLESICNARVFSQNVKIGKSLIFMTESAWNHLSLLQKFVLTRSAKLIQRRWLGVRQGREEEAQKQLQMLVGLPVVQQEIIPNTSFRKSLHDNIGNNVSLTLIETTFLRRLSLFVPHDDSISHCNTFPTDLRNSIVASLITRTAKDIFSRRFVFEDPVRVYVKRTVLTGNHVLPRRYLPQGISDAVENIAEPGPPEFHWAAVPEPEIVPPSQTQGSCSIL